MNSDKSCESVGRPKRVQRTRNFLLALGLKPEKNHPEIENKATLNNGIRKFKAIEKDTDVVTSVKNASKPTELVSPCTDNNEVFSVSSKNETTKYSLENDETSQKLKDIDGSCSIFSSNLDCQSLQSSYVYSSDSCNTDEPSYNCHISSCNRKLDQTNHYTRTNYFNKKSEVIKGIANSKIVNGMNCNIVKKEDLYDLPKTNLCISDAATASSSLTSNVMWNQEDNTFLMGNTSSYSSAGLDNSLTSETYTWFPLTKQECCEVNNRDSITHKDSSESDHDISIEPGQIEAISEFLISNEKDHAVFNDIPFKVLRDLGKVFRKHFEGVIVDLYGSYQSGLAISTSNLNFAIQSDVSVKNSFMPEVHKVLIKELPTYHILPFEEVIPVKKSKISFFEPYTSVACEMQYLGKSSKDFFRINNLLKQLCFLNNKVKTLIISARTWAESCDIHEAENGKLHPVAFALMVIHFLQQYEKPLLPIIDISVNLKELRPILGSETSVGELWLAFLKYYGYIFNWTEHVVTVTDKQPVLKSSKSWTSSWIAVEDPFAKKNIADSVKAFDVAEYIQSCFKSYYQYFLYPMDNESSKDCTDSDDYTSRRWNFSFDDCDILQTSPSSCEMCEEMDESCEECTKKVPKPPKCDLPKISDEFLDVIEKTLKEIHEDYILTTEEILERKNFVKYELQKYVQRKFEDAQLSLFGSSVNGFGFKGSDLDICLKFKNKSELEINKFQRLKVLCYHLRRHSSLENVRFVPSAQVPIVKFFYKPLGYRCDISLYNVLAIYNSRLLWTYSEIDDRCRVLGCALKLLAKKACIADAVNRTLSSFSYILMVIHFLQQTCPPVLPVLQDPRLLKENFSEPPKIVDGCNVWFFRNTKEIQDLHGPKNKKRVSELWIDLLHYYRDFDSDQVITIRQMKPMKINEKQSLTKLFRSARLFNIEDPFILSKNLGGVVSEKGAHEIYKVFQRALEIFTTHHVPKEMNHFTAHFFAPANLTKKFIKDVECTLCGKVGHKKDECIEGYPLKKKFFFRRPGIYTHFINYSVKPRRFS